MRPGDIFRARNGLTVEIGNTDAEGRLILADALTWASEQHPDLILDFATLTGAARVALGPELPVLFSNSDEVAHQILDAGKSIRDLLWQLPLHTPYATGLDSKVADLCNVAGHAFAGAIMGALFLHKFVNPAHTWCHVDVFAWNAQLRPGRPEGGEAQGLRAMYAFLAKRYQSC
jgi:leucyl aminopeptidase